MKCKPVTYQRKPITKFASFSAKSSRIITSLTRFIKNKTETAQIQY